MSNKQKKILITIDEEVYKKIKAEAKKQKRSVTNYLDITLSSRYELNTINNREYITYTNSNTISNNEHASKDTEDYINDDQTF